MKNKVDIGNRDHIVCKAIGCLGCNCLPLIQVVVDVNVNPGESVYCAGCGFIFEHGIGVKEFFSVFVLS